MRNCSLPLLFAGMSLLQAQSYDPVEKYGALLYTLLEERVSTSTVPMPPEEIVSYMNTSSVFGIAQVAGYDKREVVEACYIVGMGQDPINTTIMDALKYDMKNYCENQKILVYVAIGHLTVSIIAIFYLIGFSILYFKWDRNVIKHYRASLGGLYIKSIK